ncbi:MAG: c-type cytochrome [Bacteroidota bacterium]|nr:c-type cytochrome [Bacteroidota bacterium]
MKPQLTLNPFMKNILLPVFFLCISAPLFFTSCNQNPVPGQVLDASLAKPDFGGYESQVKYGEHLVTICGCNDCHTPKKMGPHGMELDSSRMLSGHPSEMPCADVNRKEMETKHVISTNDLTSWTGPWGTSYTANLTPDATGLANWDETTFMYAIKMGKFKGMESSRDLLPPMPWQMYRNMKDSELKAIFAYLQSIPAIKNNVPAPDKPALAAK